MTNVIDQTRMTIRLPNDLREALEEVVRQGSSSSITAEIINRLRKSFELNPLNNSDPTELIKQCAAVILDTVSKLEKTTQKKISKKMTSKPINSPEEKSLLEYFNQLPKHKKKMAVGLFQEMVGVIKK